MIYYCNDYSDTEYRILWLSRKTGLFYSSSLRTNGATFFGNCSWAAIILRLVNAVTAASKIAKTYERATDLERIGGEILSLPVPRNMLPPPTIAAYQSLPEYETISA